MKDELIKHYNLIAHPEGGYYYESFKSDINIEVERGVRKVSTAIYFLITQEEISHFHRIKSDEGWHFYLGDPLKVIEITPEGELIETILGKDFQAGQVQQYYVKAGNWFASTSLGECSFFGCTVAPGFEYEDFEMAKKDELAKEFPQHKEIIEKYSLD
jgi:predicted cupin superfamily sugar epimerase